MLLLYSNFHYYHLHLLSTRHLKYERACEQIGNGSVSVCSSSLQASTSPKLSRSFILMALYKGELVHMGVAVGTKVGTEDTEGVSTRLYVRLHAIDVLIICADLLLKGEDFDAKADVTENEGNAYSRLGLRALVSWC